MSNVSESVISEVLTRVFQTLWHTACRHHLLAWLAFLAPWIILRQFGIVILGLALMVLHFWWLRKRLVKNWSSWANADFPELEDSMQLLVQSEVQAQAQQQNRQENQITQNSALAALQAQRVLKRLPQVLHPAACRHFIQRHLSFSRLCLACSWIAAALSILLPIWMPSLLAMNQSMPAAASTKPASKLDLNASLTMHVVPPTYTGLASIDSAPKELQVPENSLVTWCIQADQNFEKLPTLSLSHGQEIRFTKTQSSLDQDKVKDKAIDKTKLCASWQASETVFWHWSGDAGKSRTVLKVLLDQAPQIDIEQPSELLQILAADTRQVKIALRIADDYKINQATMHMTLARGSGENIRFSDRELPIPQGKNPQIRQWDKTWTLTELGMEPGDELYFFVRATDNADKNPHITRSATYTLRLPAPEAQAEETSALPMLAKPESLRSQRQIIIDTEQLLADMKANPKMNPNLIRSRSETIAGDQGTLRRRYGRFLGEESSLFGDDEHAEGHSADDGHDHGDAAPQNLAAQYGHAHDQEENATLFDEATKKILRRALVAMWDAEKALRAISPATALAPENKALEAIKQLQQADRIYLHKAAFTPPAIKEDKRLTGDVLDLKNTQKQQDAAQQIVPEGIQNLLRALQSENPLPALWTTTARTWFAAHLTKEEQRLAAQAAILDVESGCAPCRPVLAGWIRQAIPQAELILQGRSEFQAIRESGFEQAWKKIKPSPRSSSSKPEVQR
ncbi:hypothetical protein [Undibacterium baiyunense]|uniref:DUF4175 family protein n=1 Tax=Undibacterium baiyunense TaxID=2828731 RepID=A0A941DEY4_9BURK|nr:hypothetical protein [Undibacterium baiyunense]MBR7745697.1 hypothetical protein [Undibacterium baiyunense]